MALWRTLSNEYKFQYEIKNLVLLMEREISKKIFLYKAYADDTTYFLKDEKSVIDLMKTFDIFSTFYGLKPNKNKCEIAGLRALKGV